jgi:hypothetical protein
LLAERCSTSTDIKVPALYWLLAARVARSQVG